jgi:hypothetical protein
MQASDLTAATAQGDSGGEAEMEDGEPGEAEWHGSQPTGIPWMEWRGLSAGDVSRQQVLGSNLFCADQWKVGGHAVMWAVVCWTARAGSDPAISAQLVWPPLLGVGLR